MSDLIERQAAIDAFEKELSAKYNRRELAIGFVGVESILRDLPSAQQIVRCKDCKYHDWCSIEDMALNDETFFASGETGGKKYENNNHLRVPRDRENNLSIQIQ